MKILALAAATAGLALTASPAFAGDDVSKTYVSLAGLDLATPEGQAMLDKRVDVAARKACQADRISTGTRLRNLEARDCYKKAKASAQRQVASVIAERQRGG